MGRRKDSPEIPDIQVLEAELARVKRKKSARSILKNTLWTLIVVAAIAILVVTIWMPVLQIYGSSMTPTIAAKDIVITLKSSDFEQGDIVGLYIGNKLLVKRIIAGPGSWVNITEDGTVYVDERELEENYITEKALGDCNIELPYQVPEDHYFVMGDHRTVSSDSRNTAVGPIHEDDIVGKIFFRVWPLNQFGFIE